MIRLPTVIGSAMPCATRSHRVPRPRICAVLCLAKVARCGAGVLVRACVVCEGVSQYVGHGLMEETSPH